MLNELKEAVARSSDTLAQDFAAGAAIFVLFLAVLHLPAFV